MPVILPPATSGSSAIPEGRFKDSANTVHYGIPGIDLFQVAGQANPTANTIYYEPMVVTTPITLDQLLIRVSATGAAGGSTARLGIYTADTDWRPVSLVVDAGTVAIDTTGIKTASISQALSVGRYLKVLHPSAVATLYFALGTIGSRGPLWAPSGNQSGVESLTVAAAYAALPASPSNWAVVNGTLFKHFVFSRVSVA